MAVSAAEEPVYYDEWGRTRFSEDISTRGDGNSPYYYLAFSRPKQSNRYKMMFQFFEEVKGSPVGRFCMLDAKNRPYECVGVVPDRLRRTCKTVAYDPKVHAPTIAEFSVKDLARNCHFTKRDTEWAQKVLKGFDPKAKGSATTMTLMGKPVPYVDNLNTLPLMNHVEGYAHSACNYYFRGGGVAQRFQMERNSELAKAQPQKSAEALVAEIENKGSPPSGGSHSAKAK